MQHLSQRPHPLDPGAGCGIGSMAANTEHGLVVPRRADEQALAVIARFTQHVRVNTRSEMPVVVLLQHVEFVIPFRIAIPNPAPARPRHRW